MFNYDGVGDWPEYCYTNNAYTWCEDITEAKILRMTLTYADFVKQRYSEQIPRHTFTPDRKGKTLRHSLHYTPLRRLAEVLQDRDPAHFVSFVFQTWGKRGFYAKFLHVGLDEQPGVAFPSLKYLSHESIEKVPAFLASNFQPKGFLPIDDFIKRERAMLEKQVRQWCVTEDKTPEDYWRVLRHLFPPNLSARYIPSFDSLKEHEWVIKEEFDITIKDLLRELPDIEGLRQELPVPESIPDEVMFWNDPRTLERINLTKEALSKGIDVEQPQFQEWLDDAVKESVNG